MPHENLELYKENKVYLPNSYYYPAQEREGRRESLQPKISEKEKNIIQNIFIKIKNERNKTITNNRYTTINNQQKKESFLLFLVKGFFYVVCFPVYVLYRVLRYFLITKRLYYKTINQRTRHKLQKRFLKYRKKYLNSVELEEIY